MKVCLILVLVALVAAIGATSDPATVNPIFGDLQREPPPPVSTSRISPRLVLENYITQKLDHFDAANTATWQMRYFSNSEHYAPGGPLFIYLGGEWEITYGWILGGHMYDMAKEMNGHIFYTEHRYYGRSYPTTDTSSANLKYLDINQALADVAHFIDYQRETLRGAKNSGVILVGASYSATMAAWFKQAYPDKANGAWASSAPLFAKADFSEYKEVVTVGIRAVGAAGCAERIERAIAQLEADVLAGDMTRIHEKFNTCTKFAATDDLDVSSFFSAIGNRFSGLIQYMDKKQVADMCSVILATTAATDVDALANYIRGSSTTCYNTAYQSSIDYYKGNAWTDAATKSSNRQWFYQTCNEFGWYQTSSSDAHIFGNKFPVTLYASMCSDIFDGNFDLAKIQANTLATNNKHNGFVPNVKNVFFTHGEFDPWRPMGVQEPLNENTPTVILKGHAHCQDLYSMAETDSEQMTKTKKEITSYVRKWLNM